MAAPGERAGVGGQIGSHRVLGLLGRGGMGEVYRAHDTKLGRDVAIKVLPAAVTSDPERRARFDREARLLATLNHPHIGAIYGVEDADGQPALVLELVEGETLADRLRRGPIDVGESLDIARQVASALEAAHDKTIIHRDLKPANIKITPDGVVKVLDFGLAKAEARSSQATDSASGQTVTHDGTRDGIVLGTVDYMSPEQARGKPVDKRTDIWSFGCLLFELLAGRRPFGGDTLTDTLASILEREPRWAVLPPTTSPAVRRLVARCLEKDSRRRLHDIADARIEIEDAIAGVAHPSIPIEPMGPRAGRLPWSIAAVASLVALIAVGSAMWRLRTAAPPSTPSHVSRTVLMTPAAAGLDIGGDNSVAMTPDGSLIVYFGEGSQIVVRALDRLEPTTIYTAPIPLNGLTVSPDGEWIAFFEGLRLKKVALAGGPAVPIAGPFASAVATWAPDNTIIISGTESTAGLARVSSMGGEVTVLTRPAKDRGELRHIFPEMLPGGRAVLFTIAAIAGGAEASQVAVLDLATNTYKVVVSGGTDAHYVRTGHLLYAAGGALLAVPFDLTTHERRGAPVTVVNRLVTTPQGAAHFAVSGDGTLVYADGTGAAGTLVWVDRQANEEPVGAPPRLYYQPRASQDGANIATVVGENGIWVWNVQRRTLNKLNFDGEGGFYPVWTPDSRRVVFSTVGPGAFGVFSQAPDVGVPASVLVRAESEGMLASDVTRDGTRVIFSQAGRDVMSLMLDGTRRIEPLIQTPFNERNGVVSPDGHWLAYESDKSSRFEIYVQPFPRVGEGQWQISTDGGTRPLWTSGGQELIYVAPDGALMAVPVETRGGSLSKGQPRKVLEGPYTTLTRASGRTYDVSPDGRRFLVVKRLVTQARPQLVVVQGWFDELRRLVPTR